MKMRTEKGKTSITIEIALGDIHEALEYVFMQRFMSLVKNEPIGVPMNDGRFPVRSLLPPTRKKVVNVYILDSEEVC